MSTALKVYLGILLSGFLGGSYAEGISQLVTVPVADQSQQSRLQGFSEAMREILVRISGKRDALESPSLSRAIQQPAIYIRRYYYQADLAEKLNPLADKLDTLIVEFDIQAIRKLLVSERIPIWSINRPRLLVWVAVEEGSHKYLLNGIEPSLVTGAIDSAAIRRGLVLEWPLASDLEIGRVTAFDIKAGFYDRVLSVSSTYSANVVLIGYITRLNTQDWQADWNLVSSQGSNRWKTVMQDLDGLIARDMDIVADSLSREFTVLGASQSEADTTLIAVSGISDLVSYADSLHYLQGLLSSNNVYVDQVFRDSVQYRLALSERMDADELLRFFLRQDNVKVLSVTPLLRLQFIN